MSLMKKLGWTCYGISAVMFLSGSVSYVLNATLIDKLPDEVKRTYYIGGEVSRIEKELDAPVRLSMPLKSILNHPKGVLEDKIKEETEHADSLSKAKEKLNEEYQALMKREDVQEGRNYKDKLGKNILVSLSTVFLSYFPFLLGLKLMRKKI
ncbi:hypothetical protein HYX16_05685 [Candidatus Woesearchaeota archaeon]|nr:hypothetical protein [Candidatus Woesearchaeota archaeon]